MSLLGFLVVTAFVALVVFIVAVILLVYELAMHAKEGINLTKVGKVFKIREGP